ncbi:MAG: [FeFe] hydrogenase H-cluster radical SAM maturase HydG [Armatimonadota bacterium]
MVSRRIVKDTGFIDEEEILDSLEQAKTAHKEHALDIVEKSKSFAGLSLDELAVLLTNNDSEVRDAVFEAANSVKERVFGSRIVFFAPLYVSNACANNCLYCSFRKDNKDLVRKVLTEEEIENETKTILGQGHKRILLVVGENPRLTGIEYIEKAVAAIYRTRSGKSSIRRVSVNCAPLSDDEFRRLKAAKIGTYQISQETYHRETYKRMHPSGPKRFYNWRIEAPDRAMDAGLDNVGIGPLFGLFDWKFEVMATLMHAQHLDSKFGIGPHSISISRLALESNAPAAENPPFTLTCEDMKRIAALLRLAVPYTEIILSTREQPELRNRLYELGVSQTNASGGYAEAYHPETEQFSINDMRNLAEMSRQMCHEGHIPSFCTACCRTRRTSGRFMKLAKRGDIHKVCEPDALISFKEYLIDYADPATRAEGEKTIAERLEKLEPAIKERTRTLLAEVESGKRDVYV